MITAIETILEQNRLSEGDISYYIGKAVLNIPNMGEEIEICTKFDKNKYITLDIDEVLEQDFEDGDTVIFGFWDKDESGVQFIIKESEFKDGNKIEIMNVIKGAENEDEVEESIVDCFSLDEFITNCY